MLVEVEPDRDGWWPGLLSMCHLRCCHVHHARVERPRSKVHIYARNLGQLRDRPASGTRGTRVRSALEARAARRRPGRPLAPGVRLPSSRDLAADLGIARNTVADAYGQLVAEGWFEARTGSGTWVAERPCGPSGRRPAVRRPSGRRLAPDGGRSRRRAARYDLRAGIPAVSAFPRRAWQAAARAALSSGRRQRARLSRPARRAGTARRRWPAIWPGPGA